MVEGRGQAALRGGIVDVYGTDARYPVRVEFWGDTVDQMRLFDPVDAAQRGAGDARGVPARV